MKTDARPVMTPGEVASTFSVDRKTVSRWADEGLIPSFRTPGGHRRFPRPAIEAFIAEQRVAGAA